MSNGRRLRRHVTDLGRTQTIELPNGSFAYSLQWSTMTALTTNRRLVAEALEELTRGARTGPMTVAVLDVDNALSLLEILRKVERRPDALARLDQVEAALRNDAGWLVFGYVAGRPPEATG